MKTATLAVDQKENIFLSCSFLLILGSFLKVDMEKTAVVSIPVFCPGPNTTAVFYQSLTKFRVGTFFLHEYVFFSLVSKGTARH